MIELEAVTRPRFKSLLLCLSLLNPNTQLRVEPKSLEREGRDLMSKPGTLEKMQLVKENAH